jgi:hypothetical protein
MILHPHGPSFVVPTKGDEKTAKTKTSANVPFNWAPSFWSEKSLHFKTYKSFEVTSVEL